MPSSLSPASIRALILKSETTLSLSDLDSWDFPGTALAVLGHPIKHSLSPLMHNTALADLAAKDSRFATWQYFRFDVPPEQLSNALRTLHQKGFHGINLTVPHKVLAVNEVDEIAPAARPVGAVNTLRRTKSGWAGFNTDGYGFATALQESVQRELTGAHVVLLGAGGAARGAAVECLQRGCASLWIANRTAKNLESLLDTLRPIAGDIPLHGFAPSEVPSDLPAGAIIVNATSAGLNKGDLAPIDLRAISRPAAVFDMIYNPPLTPLAERRQGTRSPLRQRPLDARASRRQGTRNLE